MKGFLAIGAALGAIFACVGSSVLAAPNPDMWRSAVGRLIASHQNYPRSAELRRQEGTTRLRVALAADGRVSAVDVIDSSGSPILDLAARATISDIGKLPAPPAGITTLVIPIVWRLD